VPPPLRLLVVADDALVRAGLRALAEAAGLAVSAEATTEEAAPLDASVDAALWDVGAAGGVDGLRGVAARVPLVAVLWSEDQAREALAAGARGALLRDRLDEQLAPALHAVAAGLVAVEPSLADTLGGRPRSEAAAEIVEALTPRESEVLQLLAAGLTNRRIADKLGISEHTVKFHVNAILGKLAAQTRGEAIAQAARLGLLLL
jgi:two-component system nitrate/nitrite response regulator NarL